MIKRRSLVIMASFILAFLSTVIAQDMRKAGDLALDSKVLTTASGIEIPAELGRLLVPENRNNPNSQLIEVVFVRLKSPAENPRTPLVYLEGGPGGSSTWQADDPRALDQWLPFLSVTDVILLDQRATGRSTPRLRYRFKDPVPAEIFADENLAKKVLGDRAREAAGHFRSKGFDLDGYNSNESADDINAIRVALGLEKISLYGFSYGSHLALATIRRHEAHLAHVIAVGVEGLDQTLKLPLDMDTQFRKIALMAAEDERILPFIPDLVDLLKRVSEKLGKNPMMVTVFDWHLQKERQVPVGKSGLHFILRRDIGDASDLPVFPRLLYSIDQGDASVLQWFVQKRWPGGSTDLMGLLVDGASGVSPERLAMIQAQAEVSLFGNIANFPWPEIDRATGVKYLDVSYREPLVSNVRALFLTGTLDYNTPPYQAEQVRWGMPNTTHLVVENAGHEQIYRQRQVVKTMIQFLQGEDVRDVKVTLPSIRFVPIEGYDPEVTHPSTRLAQQLLGIIIEEHVDAALAEYRRIRQKHQLDGERELNALGYELLSRKRVQDAIVIFKRNVDDHPQSWNVYDSLGEAYNTAGDLKNAIENYKKSLSYNPDNDNARKFLEKLQAQ